MRKRMRNGEDPRRGCGTDMGIKWGTDIRIKCVILMSFSPHFYVSVFLFLFFCNGCNVVVLVIHN